MARKRDPRDVNVAYDPAGFQGVSRAVPATPAAPATNRRTLSEPWQARSDDKKDNITYTMGAPQSDAKPGLGLGRGKRQNLAHQATPSTPKPPKPKMRKPRLIKPPGLTVSG